MRSTGQMVVKGDDQESGIGLRGDHGWLDSTMVVKKENQEGGRGDHGWMDSTVGTAEMVVEREDQESGREIMARRTDRHQKIVSIRNRTH
jgi:hypothetical protein